MSYSISEARYEEEAKIGRAIKEDDDITLFLMAQYYAEQGDDEYADYLKHLAKKAQRNNWAYDEHVDNSL